MLWLTKILNGVPVSDLESKVSLFWNLHLTFGYRSCTHMLKEQAKLYFFDIAGSEKFENEGKFGVFQIFITLK